MLPAGSGQLYLIDTSAQARIAHPAVCKIIAGRIADGAQFEHIAAITGQPQAWVAPRGDLA